MRIARLFLALALILCGVSSAAAAVITTTGTQPSVGNGNRNNPYEIRTAEELRWFVHYENTRHWYPNDYAKLMADIDLSSICGPDKGSWIPLGYSEESGAKDHWYGSLEGNGYTVSGLYIDCDDLGGKPAGFCGKVSSGKIYNLTVQGEILKAYGKVGGLIGWDYDDCAFVQNCISKVDIHLYDYYSTEVGGLIGSCDGFDDDTLEEYYITNCTYEGKINGEFMIYCGSLIGRATGLTGLLNCSGYCGYADDGGSSFEVPLVGSSRYTLYMTNCISDSYLIGEYTPYADCRAILTHNYHGPSAHCYYQTDAEIDETSCSALPHAAFGSGEACVKMNQLAGGQYYKQTLGTQKIPTASGAGSTVYLVKQYTTCGSDKFYYQYSNSSSDITDKREHVFVAEHAYCTACGKAVNPNYGIDKDVEGYYLADSAEDIKWLWNLVNVTGVTDANIRLTADINMEGEALEPLALFKGEIDGQNHTLSNINISCSGVVCVGLVGDLAGSVRNLTLSGSVEGTYVTYIGAVAGQVRKDASISNVRNECTVKVTGTMNGDMAMYIGGVAGFAAGTVSNCINCGPVVDASTCTGRFRRYIAGLVGSANYASKLSRLVNNAVVGASSDAVPVDGGGNAVANIMEKGNINSFYVKGIANPGLAFFFSDSADTNDTAVNPVDVGSGKLAWLLAGKDYDAGDNATVFFGQTIGTDLVPYPFVSEDHKGVYNTCHYYTCDSYSEYSNSPTGEEAKGHTWNDSHYCSVCCSIDPEHVPQDPATKAYLISSTDQYNIFASALNAAADTSKPMKYASASIKNDLDFSSNAPTAIYCLYGRIHGNGHKMNLSDVKSPSYIATTIGQDGIIEYLDVAYPSDNFYSMAYDNNGRIVGCNITHGIPAAKSAGLVMDCTGELPSSKTLYGRHSRCLVRMITISGTEDYHLYTGNAAADKEAGYTEYSVAQAMSGELAYALSHDSDGSAWGQNLGTDAAPRIYFNQSKTSNTFVTRVQTYSVSHPEGGLEYLNAGHSFKPAPGVYHVTTDPDCWTTAPVQFIVDGGDGSYTAERFEMSPTAEHHMPLTVEAKVFAFNESFSEGDLVSVMFPVDMPLSNINGTPYIFYAYSAGNSQMEFTSAADFEYLPANTPILVKANGGQLLRNELTDVTVYPMTETGDVTDNGASHMAAYRNTLVPASDESYWYYILSGSAAHKAPARSSAAVFNYVANAASGEAETSTVAPLQAYFRVPAIDGEEAPESLSVLLGSNTPTSVDAAEMEAQSLYPCDIWTLAGARVLKADTPADLQRLTPGYYIVVTPAASLKLRIR